MNYCLEEMNFWKNFVWPNRFSRLSDCWENFGFFSNAQVKSERRDWKWTFILCEKWIWHISNELSLRRNELLERFFFYQSILEAFRLLGKISMSSPQQQVWRYDVTKMNFFSMEMQISPEESQLLKEFGVKIQLSCDRQDRVRRN